MERKQNESEFGVMMRQYGFHARKSRDRGYISCPKCHTPLKTCPRCHGDMLLNKAETLPDFILSWRYVYVEGKGGGARWAFMDSITPTQRRVMAEDGVDGWLFLEMGEGRAPDGRAAYLVPWEEWCKIEEGLLEKDCKSIVFENGPRGKSPTSDELLSAWKLTWKKGGWVVQTGHPFWVRYPDAYEQARKYVLGVTDGHSD